MTRYYLLATLIVVMIGSLIFAHRLTAPDLRVSAQATGTPTVESAAPPQPRSTPAAFTAQGPWVLSALPACFDEQSRIRGPYAALRTKVPSPSARVAPGTTLTSGACTVQVRAHDLIVHRGEDRLRVPPDAALYRVNGRLTLVARDGAGVEIRRY